MNPNDIINSAFIGYMPTLYDQGLYIIEANPEKNEMRIKNIRQMSDTNLNAFAQGEGHGFIVVGIYNSNDAAEQAMHSIRQLVRDTKGNSFV